MSFAASLPGLPASVQDRVATHFEAWRSGASASWRQIAANIEAETALPLATFKAMLEAFVASINASVPPESAWIGACRQFQFHGATLPRAAQPMVLGRAMAIGQYANQIGQAASLPTGAAIKMLQKYAGCTAVRAAVERSLRSATLGRYVVWATFNEADRAVSPFDAPSRATRDIRGSLGLGGIPVDETLILIAYTLTGSQPVHRPTVAEAGDYEFYRPHHDPDHAYGYTCPLTPNLGPWTAQPELVHREVDGAGILFPFHLTTT